MSGVYVLGIDPGFASVGAALVELLPEGEKPTRLSLLTTTKSDAKQDVLASNDNFRRARELARLLRGQMQYDDGFGDSFTVSALCIESMSFPRNASAAAKVAISWGVLAALAEDLGIPVLQASPQKVKKAVCQNLKASKEEVQAAINLRYGDLAMNGLLAASRIPRSNHEHPIDALAVVVACLDSDIIRMARSMSGKAAK